MTSKGKQRVGGEGGGQFVIHKPIEHVNQHYNVTKNKHYNDTFLNREVDKALLKGCKKILKNPQLVAERKWKLKKIRELRTLKFPAPFLNGLSEPFYQFLVEFIKK